MRKVVFIIMLGYFFSSIALAEQKNDVIIPLETGNYWKFNTSDGKKVYARVEGKVKLNGKTWYKYVEISDVFYIRNDAGGQFEYDMETKEEFMVLPYPVTKKTKYKQLGINSMVTPNVRVKVPAGQYTAYQYDFALDDPEYATTVYFAPGVGPIKIEFEGITYELLEYKLK